MTVTNYYKVAGHTFGVSGEAGVFALMDNYAPCESWGQVHDCSKAAYHATCPRDSS